MTDRLREWRKESETDRENGERERDRLREWRKESETDRENGAKRETEKAKARGCGDSMMS